MEPTGKTVEMDLASTEWIPDYTGFPTHQCPCGSTMFKTVVSFDDYEIAWYTLSGYCYECGAKVTLPCEVDRVGDSSMVTV